MDSTGRLKKAVQEWDIGTLSQAPSGRPTLDAADVTTLLQTVLALFVQKEAQHHGGDSWEKNSKRLAGVKITEWHGSRKPGVYKRWKKEVLAQQKLHAVTNSQLAVLIYLSCRGAAKDALEILELEQLVDEKVSLSLVWKLLDECCDQVEDEKYDSVHDKREQCMRKPGEDMSDYLTSLKVSDRALG